ncbi:hypothetical protein SLUN_19465 [Streptomyces lunaelactis]|uniref:Uncharacterized protein n=1 Tax=Streptomyces lunaelactis TaxID=1535768 RepID=A0A2R4T4I1_9ACTN|nr:hypothetical protein [Streptomyces lunaelactis]AVZ74016.1 hypothetical protein SLUN_19465 [Streptomyces lunaelactis]
MSTTATARASHAPAELPVTALDVDGLVVEIERYLAARVRTTAHPLLTKTTQELVTEALAQLGTALAPDGAVRLTAPSAFLRRLPDWVLGFPLLRAWHGGGRPITAAENLELVALVIERFGWTQGTERGNAGQRCLIGAQYVLHRLGYGDVDTLRRASHFLQDTLGTEAGSYVVWNDREGRTRDQVLRLVRTAAANAREAGR